MTPVLIMMGVALGAALLTLVYAAWPGRGESVPGAPWLGDLMERAGDAVPTLDADDLEDEPSRR